ncbi:MAG TPA: ATP-binding protein [Phycisphaerae bacterium]|jgi:signal transduction histidine kinase|nr:HAMP domain-containing protein [Phycisphaerae bacterium]HOB76677.1 ATP-binding protein [Phycisphaerae bacterium]HOJ56707.1 ATP-binding protein [Phycisphaerae bacterium]HOL27179.1 ATP-binding protein [Phycisphaerae bacterium]HPP22960.1 ATP-binding protein [Phycisphaerae bacterium]
MLKNWLSHFGFRRRYLLGYMLMLTGGAVVLVWLHPVGWPGIVGMWGVSIATGTIMVRLGGNSFRRGIRRLREAADAIGRGELQHRIDLRGHDDFAKLAGSLDRMAACLEAHIHEREALQKDLNRVEKLALIGELAATVAHEVNNPLDGLQGALQIIRRAHPGDDQIGRLLDLMEGGLHRIELMVQRLLGLARPSPLELAPVDLEEVLGDAMLFAGPRFSRAHIKLEHDFPDEPLVVRADAMQLAQVFINLMLNAADAMPEGGRLRLTGRGDVGRVVLEISDTGMGIKPADLPHVFEPFWTTKQQGTGLGLAVVARIIQAHQGRVDVRSEVGKGTTFRIELPAADNEGASTG